MTVAQRHLTSPLGLQALAHPLRLRLLDLLASEGAFTANEAGRRLSETPANVSWHLRQLGKYGFVRQAKGPGRARPWRYVGQSLTAAVDAEEAAVSTALTDVVYEREFQLLRSAQRSGEVGDSRRAATAVVRSHVWLTPAEAQALGEKLEALLDDARLRERSQQPALRPSGARLMALMGWVLPIGEPPDPDLPWGDGPQDRLAHPGQHR